MSAPMTPQLATLKAHLQHYAAGALIDWEPIDEFLAFLCSRYQTENFMVALSAYCADVIASADQIEMARSAREARPE